MFFENVKMFRCLHSFIIIYLKNKLLHSFVLKY